MIIKVFGSAALVVLAVLIFIGMYWFYDSKNNCLLHKQDSVYELDYNVILHFTCEPYDQRK